MNKIGVTEIKSRFFLAVERSPRQDSSVDFPQSAHPFMKKP